MSKRVAGRRWRFLVHGLPDRALSPNNVRGAHWSIYHRAAADLMERTIRYFYAAHLPVTDPARHARITVEYRRCLKRTPAGDHSYRPLDVQNAIAALKPALDALTREVPPTLRRAGRGGVGVIYDDDWRCLEELTLRLVEVASFAEEGLYFVVTELVEREEEVAASR